MRGDPSARVTTAGPFEPLVQTSLWTGRRSPVRLQTRGRGEVS